MELRPYQERIIESTREEIRNGKKRVIIHAPTGSGKTIIAASIVSSALEKGKKVLFLVHFRELAYQAIERFNEFGIGDEVGIIMAGEDHDLGKPVQVASVQTYGRRLNLDTLEYNPWFCSADLVIYDECHSSIARTRKGILNIYKKDSIILGLTATPCRADGRGLGEVYQGIVSCSGIDELTELGHLVKVVYYGCKEMPDLKNIPIVAGDYNRKVLGERVDKPKLIGDIYDNWARIAPGRQTVIFATNVKHSRNIKELFEQRGVSIEHVDAHTPEEERRNILNRFRDNQLQVVTNVGVYSEGADFPWVGCVVLAKPSKSYARFVQMAGRGLRPYPGKENCIVIDHAGLVYNHGFLEDEVDWTLDGKDKAWKQTKTRKKEEKILSCDTCGFLFTGRRCPQCGTELKNYSKRIATTDDELVEIGKNKKRKATMEEKRRFFGMLEYKRREKGYAQGWSAHKYRERFSVWPNKLKDTGPIIPDREFNNYMTHLAIKWSKSKDNPKNRVAPRWTLTE